MSRLNLSSFDSIGFDLDGTLWDATYAIEGAWKSFMSEDKDILRVPTPDELKKVMGLPLKAIMERLFPYLPEEKRGQMIKDCIKAETAYIKENGAKLFDGLEEVLRVLSQSHKLYIVSNCQKGYINSFLSYYNFEKYFCDHECIGSTGLPKGENIKLVIERNNFKNSVFIGDTQGDYDAAKKAGISFIFAEYGFGEVEDKGVNKIGSIYELLQL